MQHASRGTHAVAVGLIALLMGCRAAEVVAPVTGTRAVEATYAYSTPYGEMWEENGELMPAGYGNPWNAPVFDQSSSIDHNADCGIVCTVRFTASMRGLWHATSQKIHWQVDGRGGTAEKPGFGWSCMAYVGPLNCLIAQRSDVHEVNVIACNWSATVRADHAAWWARFFDYGDFTKKIGQVGRTEASSLGVPLNRSFCSGGGDSGARQCYDFYLVWNDQAGHHEEYIGTRCYGEAET